MSLIAQGKPGGSTGRRVDVDAILDRVDLATVATNLLGPPPGRRGETGRRLWWRCPFHDDANPSLCIEVGKRWWRCFGCGEHGTAIDLTVRLGALDFLTACRRLCELAGIEPSTMGLSPAGEGGAGRPENRTPKKGERVSPARGRADGLEDRHFLGVRFERPPLATTGYFSGVPSGMALDGPRGLDPADALALVERASRALWEPEGADTLDLLHRRGFRDATIRDARLGWTDSTAVPRADGGTFRTRGLVIPWHERGRLAMVKIRPPDGSGGPKYVEAFRDRPSLYIAAPIRPGRPLILVEGELDALIVAQEAGEWAGVASLGSASGKVAPAALAELAGASPWLIALDADGAGDRAALDWLTPFTARCRRVRPPADVKDWNDLHINNPGSVRCLFARLAGEPPPILPEGWTYDRYLDHLRSGGSPRP